MFKPKEINEIELFSVEAHAPGFCGCHATIELEKRSKRERPRFDKITLKKVRRKGDEITFRVRIKESGGKS